MLWRVCVGCFSQRDLVSVLGASLLCRVCSDEVAELRCSTTQILLGGPPLADITAFYHYQGLIRRLIIRAKVGGDLPALRLLLTLVQAHPTRPALTAWSQGLMPCASSLWGRVRGRIDIASQICKEQAHGPLQVVTAPLHLHWRWRKHAMLGRHQRNHGEQDMPEWFKGLSLRLCTRTLAAAKVETLLLVDDVVTSGDTMRRTAAAVHAAAPLPLIRGLALAVS